MITKEVAVYETWSDFKSELQRRSGVIILNKQWLQIKPEAPLPWYETHMKEALRGLSGRIQRLRVCPRCGGNLMMDRDFDGYYKRCIQCSFEVELASPAKRPSQTVRLAPNNWKPGVKVAVAARS
jgi:hypothetical protein